jgi:hypothetical protein
VRTTARHAHGIAHSAAHDVFVAITIERYEALDGSGASNASGARYRSTDGGVTWTREAAPQTPGPRVPPANPRWRPWATGWAPPCPAGA